MRKAVLCFLVFWFISSSVCFARPVSVGYNVGMFASATELSVEGRFPLSHYSPGITTTALRLALGFAQSGDSSTRYVPVHCDLIYNFPAGYITGVENYIGVGLNYAVRASGGAGSLGYEVFYGVESGGFGGRVFGEVGLATLKGATAQAGTTLLFGWRREI
ncbi:MAG: hypothetical protein ABH823_05895 [bacterium]